MLMSNYLSQIAQRAAPKRKEENSLRPVSAPAPNIGADPENATVFIAESLYPPIEQTESKERLSDPLKTNIESNLEKKETGKRAGYLDMQLQRGVAAYPPQPVSPIQAQKNKVEKSAESSISPIQEQEGKTDQLPAYIQKEESKTRVNILATSKEAMEKEESAKHLVFPIPSTIQFPVEEKTENLQNKQVDDWARVSIEDIERANQKVWQNMARMITPEDSGLGPIEKPQKNSAAAKLSIGKISVEVISPSPKVQTEQRIVYRGGPSASPKTNNRSTNKLIFGLGQM